MLCVQKFGGSSVATVEKIKNVASRVAAARRDGNDVVVIVSAMGKTTDQLIALSKEVSPRPPEREHDVLVSTGEIVSSALLAIALEEMGVSAISMTGLQVGMRTDAVHTKAKIISIKGSRAREELSRGRVVVVAGFQGYDEKGDTTTLGRGGSDTTAVAMAAALGADVCEIFTDVDGVYTADPRICPKAAKLDRIAYDEMLELASAGAKVMQSRSIEFGKKFGVRIHVRSSFHEGEGTMIEEYQGGMEEPIIRGIAHNANEAKITVAGLPDKPGIAAAIFGRLADQHIGVDVIVQSATSIETNDISFTINKDDLEKALEIVREAARELGTEDIRSDSGIGKVSVVGVGMASHAGIAARAFRCLAEAGINIEMITTSEIKITVVVKEDRLADAVQILHEAFGLDA